MSWKLKLIESKIEEISKKIEITPPTNSGGKVEARHVPCRTPGDRGGLRGPQQAVGVFLPCLWVSRDQSLVELAGSPGK